MQDLSNKIGRKVARRARTLRTLHGLVLTTLTLGCAGASHPADKTGEIESPPIEELEEQEPKDDAAVAPALTPSLPDAGARPEADASMDAVPPALPSPAEASDSLHVRVEGGLLEGKRVGSTREFLGVPYAKPPVGALRFAPPEPFASWQGTRPALALGPACPQPPGALAAAGPQSEDCLTLNVYAPDAPAAPRPVMVFLHGGAFVSGASSQYDGQRLSETADGVVVTLNYRLGALGFLALSALDAERPEGVPSGNDAIRDQQLALRWVRANIAAFGGDPEKITLFGESAGSMSTCLHMVSPESADLADAFIMESGVCVAGMPLNKVEQAREVGAKLVTALCAEASDVLACLREKPASELAAWGADDGISGAGWGPVIHAEDPLLPAHPMAIIQGGQYNHGPIVVGSNAREWGLFEKIGASPKVTTVAELNAAIDEVFGSIATLVKVHYLTLSDAQAGPTFTRIMTDAVFRCPARMLARLATAQGSSVYLYSFEEGSAHHAFELPYVFGNPNEKLGAATLVEPLRAAMQSYWSGFASTGAPAAEGQPSWPRYDTLGDRHMTLKSAPATGKDLSRSDCDFWEPLQRLPS